jgi:hypothetical protein
MTTGTLARQRRASILRVRPPVAGGEEIETMGATTTSGQGSAGNVIAAICSLIIPGLGQLVQGRVLSAIGWHLFAWFALAVTWLLTLSLLPFGWPLVALFSCISAAVYKAPAN